MSHNDLEEDSFRQSYTKPYGGKHPIPTVQGYRQHKKEIEEQYGSSQDAQQETDDDSRPRRAYNSAKTILKGQDDSGPSHDPYPTVNQNDADRPQKQPDDLGSSAHVQDSSPRKEKKQEQSATEIAASSVDPKQKRKAMKKSTGGGGREVTDPVTHLPIMIHDQTDADLNNAPENESAPGSQPRTATGLSGATKDRDQLEDERHEAQRSYNGLQKTFPPPSFQNVEKELASLYTLALTVGLSAILALSTAGIVASRVLPSTLVASTVILTFVIGTGAFVTYGIRGWLNSKVKGVWEDETWESQRKEESQIVESDVELPESVNWMNSLLSSVWPLINPDLFASLVDTLEDVMQASLPKIVRMVSVDDMGQGSESIRILGIKWLPTGAASQSVDDEGNLRGPEQNQPSDRTDPNEGQQDQSAGDGEDSGQTTHSNQQSTAEKKQQEQTEEAMRAGLEAEEGDFVNMEVAFAYRARSSGKSIKSKSKNAHLYLKFYLPGGIAIPVWVELRGIMGIMRVRLQLTPDPPFFSVCTFTFLGQPKADLSCVPLSKHSLNLMDVPLISSFVQSAIDAALAEYVAPKSLTLDMKDMLMGEDYKKDTNTRGVVWIFIKEAQDFKQGDGAIGPFGGASDAYVTVSWGKFGKPVASTRVIVDEQRPSWHEWSSILVSPEELNADERLRLQLWDSDKWTADDDLGRVEVDLHDLMNNPDTKNRMCDRHDRLKGVDLEEDMPGTLTWAVGYFEKARITDQQLQKQTYKKDIQTKDQLKDYVAKLSERKLREANIQSGHDDELHQQKIQDYRDQENNMIISAPPSKDHVSGILSIQIHNITGLEVSKPNKDDDEGHHPESESGADGEMPDSYCTIIMNHTKIYKTRTKPRNGKPFFNAGTERFVRDWTNTEIIVSVRDSREREDDALLGVVYLPLKHLFAQRSQFMENFPLVGGIGHGRARISMVWRSVELQLPPRLRGWDYGTVQVKGTVRAKTDLDDSIHGNRLKLRTNISKAKLQYQDGEWKTKRGDEDDSVFLAVRKRYASALLIEFRKSSIGPDKTAGFSILWLSELTDEEEQTMTLKVFKGDKKNLARAQNQCDYEGLVDDGQSLGEIEITLKFWCGLSGYHKSHAQKSKNADVRNVMECLDTVNDEGLNEMYSDASDSDDSDGSDTETESGDNSPRRNNGSGTSNGGKSQEDDEEANIRRKLRTNTNKSEKSGDDSDTESTEDGGFAKVKAPLNKVQEAVSNVADKIVGDHDIKDDGSRGVRAQAQDYKKNHKELHRKHRGIMQWKGIRTLDWAGGKAKRAKSKVSEIFDHDEKDQGIETEV